MPKLKRGTIIPNDEEDEIITGQAIEDNTMLTDEQLATMSPVADNLAMKALVRRGRPPKKNPKESTTIRLDAEVLKFFKGQGKGWQTKINAILQKYVDSHHTV